MKTAFVNSRITGGHFAFQTEKSDKPFTNKMTEAMLVKLVASDVVVDIGGYVGEFSLYASRQGVKNVTCFEPTPETFKLLSKNVAKFPNIKAVNAAIVGGSEKYVELFISKGVGVTNSIAKRKGTSVKVKAVNYKEAVKNATVVKIDCEGAEYSFDIVQPKLRAIILEFHPITGVDWQSNAMEFMKTFKKKGFKPLAVPEFSNGWDMHTTWIKP
jgi:FkbM family methyltransferase